MVNSEQGQKLGDEVWNEMIEIFEKEAPDIRRTVIES